MGALPATMGRAARVCVARRPSGVRDAPRSDHICSQACAATRDVQHCCQFALAGTRWIRHCLLTLPHAHAALADAHACRHHVVLSGPVMSARKKYNINYPVLYATEADCKNEVRRLSSSAPLLACLRACLRCHGRDQMGSCMHKSFDRGNAHSPCPPPTYPPASVPAVFL